MFYFIVPLAVLVLAAIIYTALSKKSGFRTRIAALIALALMLLSVIVCAVLLLSGPALVEEDIGPLDLPVEKSVSGGSDLWIFLAFIVFLIALFVVVAVLSFREQRRLRNAKQSSGSKAA